MWSFEDFSSILDYALKIIKINLFKSSALISLFRMTCSDHNHGGRSTGLILKTGNCQKESIKADGVILIDVVMLT